MAVLRPVLLTLNRRMAGIRHSASCDGCSSLQISLVLGIMALLSVSCRRVPTVYRGESIRLNWEGSIWKTSPSCSGLPMSPGLTTNVWAATMEVMAGATLTIRVSHWSSIWHSCLQKQKRSQGKVSCEKRQSCTEACTSCVICKRSLCVIILGSYVFGS